MSPRVLIVRAPGTNCDEETAHAFTLAGAVAERWHVNRLLERPNAVADCQIVCFPGGFSYGDDVAAGRILGNQIRHRLADALLEFRESGKLILGICNGFQVLLKTELLAANTAAGPAATLAANDSGHLEDRWVRLRTAGNKCVFLAGIDELELPVAHGEGKFVPRDAATLDALRNAGQLVLRYERAGSSPTPMVSPGAERGTTCLPYPDNPNGAIDDVAGMCDVTGQVFGLMPHPERFIDPTQHPTWTRGPRREAGDGLRVFQNAVRYFT